MELPDWIVDDLRAAKPTAFRLAVLLFRHGRPQVGHRGERRAYFRGSKQQLARMAGASKRAIDEAEAELAALGLITVHQAIGKDGSGHAISAPYERQGGANFAPPPDSTFPQHDDVPDPLTDPSCDQITTTTPGPEKGVQILHLLHDRRVTAPTTWIARWGADRCDRALALLEATETRGTTIANPAGFLHTLLSSKNPLPPRALPETFTAESLAGWRARYIAEQRAQWAPYAAEQRARRSPTP